MNWSRRDLLAAFLGAPFAALACARPRTHALPPGALAGASNDVGHRLRQHLDLQPREWTSHDVVIVGAGVAGLTAAWKLQRDYVILELEAVEGGTARSGRSRVSAFPWGAHYIPAPLPGNTLLRELLGEMGMLENGEPREDVLCRDPEERLFYRGRWYEGLYLNAGASNDDLRQLHEFEREIDRWTARKSFAIPTSQSVADPDALALDGMSMAQWMDSHRWTSPRLRWFVEYACRDDYGATLADTSAWAGVFYFAARLAGPGAKSSPLLTWPEGNGRLVAHLASRAAGRIDRGWLVTSVVPVDEGVDVIAMSRDGRSIRGIHAKKVIYAAPQFTTPHVIRGFDRDVHDFVYGSWMVANLTLRDRPKSEGFPLSWDNVMYESPSLGYVVATHQSGIDYGPTVLTYYYPMTDHVPRVARERLLSAGRDEWADVALADLERAHPEIRSLTERVDIMRWGHAMIRPHPGFITNPARRRAAEPFRNIHFANTDLSGVALFEEALDHGVRAAREVSA